MISLILKSALTISKFYYSFILPNILFLICYCGDTKSSVRLVVSATVRFMTISADSRSPVAIHFFHDSLATLVVFCDASTNFVFFRNPFTKFAGLLAIFCNILTKFSFLQFLTKFMFFVIFLAKLIFFVIL